MGNASSIEVGLDYKEYEKLPDTFEGTLLLTNKGNKTIRLQRFARVSLQLRVTFINRWQNWSEEAEPHQIVEIWKVGGSVAEKGAAIEAGKTMQFPFSFPIGEKERELMKEQCNAKHWVKEQGRYKYAKYEFVLRAGSPPQVNDLIKYPFLGQRGQIRALGKDMEETIVDSEGKCWNPALVAGRFGLWFVGV